MKKIAIASIIALAATSASALELGVTVTRDYAGADRNFGGVTIGQSYGKVTATAGFERTDRGVDEQNRWSLVGGYDLVNLGPVVITPKVGVHYLDNKVLEDGYATTVGVGASVPLTKSMSIGVDVMRQYGQKRVDQFDDNRATVSVRYKF